MIWRPSGAMRRWSSIRRIDVENHLGGRVFAHLPNRVVMLAAGEVLSPFLIHPCKIKVHSVDVDKAVVGEFHLVWRCKKPHCCHKQQKNKYDFFHVKALKKQLLHAVAVGS